MVSEIIIAIIAALAALAAVIFLLKAPILQYLQMFLQKMLEENLRTNEERNKELFREERERLSEQYRAEKALLEEKLKTDEKFIEHKKDSIKELVEKIHSELSESQKKLEHTEKERIGEFSKLKAVLDEYKIITGGLKESADSLKNILSNNQLRGKYGEEVAENLLKSVGFVRGQNYVANESQDTAATRPDFTIFLPDGTKVNVDAKFPLSALIKYQESEDKQEKERHLREFTADVKQKIKQVTTRDYINPEEKTVDFVILFVPNEMIFSFIYDHLNEAWDEAMKKKVIMAGPFSFTAILRMIFQSYKNFKYQENLYDIIKLIKIFEQEYEKFNAALDILGSRIQSASNQYQVVSVTRTKKLSGVMEKIKGENVLFENQETQPLLLSELESVEE
jgi:DNA recombination protein RmuC